MTLAEEIVARRYAKAFILTFHKNFPQDFLEKNMVLHIFFTTHKEFTILLNLSSIQGTVKRQFLDTLCSSSNFIDLFKPLLDLLQAHKRLFLFPLIVRATRSLYKEFRGVMEWHLTSYPLLEQQGQKVVTHYLEQKTGKKALVTYQLDKSLIAGIRAQSDCFLWEHSVRCLLQSLSHNLQER